MSKRKRIDISWAEQVIDDIFNQALTSGCKTPRQTLLFLKPLLLNKLRDNVQKAAGDFTEKEVADLFQLSHQEGCYPHWEIEKDWECELNPKASPSLCNLLSQIETYKMNFSRSSEAMCRTTIDILLNESLTSIKWEDGFTLNGNDQPKNPTVYHDVWVHGEISFRHTVSPPPTTWQPAQDVIVTGRLDYGVGRMLKSTTDAKISHRRRFQSLLVIVEAKTVQEFSNGLSQLLAYLACLHHSRIQHRRKDATVYGVLSDGHKWTFVTITHDGVIKVSRTFDVNCSDVPKILACLRYIFTTAAGMSPNVTPELRGFEDDDASKNNREDFDDSPIHLDDDDDVPDTF